MVNVEDFGQLQAFAFEPELYTNTLKELDLAAYSSEVQGDLDKGNWLFGRGIMDMKAGLAMQLAVLSELSEKGFDGNLLLVSVPDEERNSDGMLSVIPFF